ncbi:protein-tyrosine-phosphatase, partial [Clavibacter lycopersici]
VSAVTATAARHAGPSVATGGTSVAADPWPGVALAALGLGGLAALAGRTVVMRRRALPRRP